MSKNIRARLHGALGAAEKRPDLKFDHTHGFDWPHYRLARPDLSGAFFVASLLAPSQCVPMPSG
jgi:hypothetical protein